MGPVNLLGILLTVFLLIPLGIWRMFLHNRKESAAAISRPELLGWCLCILLMAFPQGFKDAGFSSAGGFVIYLILDSLLIMVDWGGWLICLCRPGKTPFRMLSAIPPLVFLVSGILLPSLPLIAAAAFLGYLILKRIR